MIVRSSSAKLQICWVLEVVLTEEMATLVVFPFFEAIQNLSSVCVNNFLL